MASRKRKKKKQLKEKEMTDKERYDEIVATIQQLINEMKEENSYGYKKTYKTSEVIELLESVIEYQE